jgi:hypothetical protein
MTEKELQDVLAEHADSLMRDEESGDRLLAEHQEQAAELAPLFQLASSLRAALTPVSAPAFKKQLGHELVKYGPPVIVLGRSISKRRARAWLAEAAAGSLLSAAGVAALLLRRVRNVEDVTAQPAAAT